MNNRRDFLKLFGVGAAVAPVIAGLPLLDHQAKLIETPNIDVQPVERMPHKDLLDMFAQLSKVRIQINISDERGRIVTYQSPGYLKNVELNYGCVGLNAASSGDIYASYVPSIATMPEMRMTVALVAEGGVL